MKKIQNKIKILSTHRLISVKNVWFLSESL